MKKQMQYPLIACALLLLGGVLVVAKVAKEKKNEPAPVVVQQPVNFAVPRPAFYSGAQLAILKRGTIRDLGTYALSGTERNQSEIGEVHMIGNDLYVWEQQDDEFMIGKLDIETGAQTHLLTGSGWISSGRNGITNPMLNFETGMIHRDGTLFFIAISAPANRTLFAIDLASGKSRVIDEWKDKYQVAIAETDTARGSRLILTEEYRENDGMHPDRVRHFSYNDASNSFNAVDLNSLQVRDPYPIDPIALECTSINDPVCTKIMLLADGKRQTLVDPYSGGNDFGYSYYDAEGNVAFYPDMVDGLKTFVRHDVATGDRAPLFPVYQQDALFQAKDGESMVRVSGSGVTVYSLPGMEEISSFSSPEANQLKEKYTLFESSPSEGYYSGVLENPLRRLTVFDDAVGVKAFPGHEDFRILHRFDDDTFLLLKQWSPNR